MRDYVLLSEPEPSGGKHPVPTGKQRAVPVQLQASQSRTSVQQDVPGAVKVFTL